jgi:hypothetical protein
MVRYPTATAAPITNARDARRFVVLSSGVVVVVSLIISLLLVIQA